MARTSFLRVGSVALLALAVACGGTTAATVDASADAAQSLPDADLDARHDDAPAGEAHLKDARAGDAAPGDAAEPPADSASPDPEDAVEPPADTAAPDPEDAAEPPADTAAPDPGDAAEPPTDSASPDPGDAAEPPADSAAPDPGEVAEPDGAGEVVAPTANPWSWNGSWIPADADFPLACLFDDEYDDGHLYEGVPTPILPPGAWDWNDANDDFANWRNFETQIGHFDPLLDPQGRQFGWRLVGNNPDAVEMDGPAGYFEGSCGVDLLDLGPQGSLHSYGQGSLGDGPDVLRVTTTWSLDFRTGSSATGHAHDDDLILAGGAPNTDGAFDLSTCTLHTGPGDDLVFVRDIERSAIDLGNGANGRTDTIDPGDGDDVALIGGNTLDFRVFGGYGDDVEVWYVDENIQTTWWLGPNFFGGGGFTGALWEDPGVDRLVLAVPTDTLVRLSPTTATPPGALSVLGTNGQWIGDDPTVADPYAAYCIECGEGPGGRRTVIFEYRSADDSVFTAYFYVTAVEQLQLGLGPQAHVFTIDDVNGTLLEEPGAASFEPPAWPDQVPWVPGQ